jgi:iron complex outermembrane recepter protein
MSVRNRLCRSSSLAGGALAFVVAAIPATVLAQDADAASSEPVTSVEEIIITGSRIARPNLEQPAPVATVSREAIETAGTANLGDIIAELPGLSSTDTVRGNADSYGDSGGLNFANLRSLGASRTLTLVNGLRHVGGDAGTAAVDLNSIPSSLVERVEIVTGGASAIYGSDAVSGVVNIILRDDFEGTAFTAEYGGAEGGVGQRWQASATVGGNFANDRGNVTFTYFADHTDAVTARDAGARDLGSVLNPDDTGPNDGVFDRITYPWVGSDLVDENGVIIDGFTLLPVSGFTVDGVPVQQPDRIGYNSAAFHRFGEYCDTCFFGDDWVLVVPDTDRQGFNTRAHYDFTPNIRGFVDAKYVRTEVLDYVQPSFTFGEYLLAPDNAFIPDALRPQLAGTLPLIGRFNGDIGPRENDITRETYRVVTGLEGDFSTGFADFDWNLSYNYGRTSNNIQGSNNQIPGNYEAAIDAVVAPDGSIQCRMNVPTAQGPDYVAPVGMTTETCVPYNVFGQQNSQAAIDYVSHESQREHTITQEVVLGTIGFDSSRFLNLPGGPIDMVLGFEYREETSANINDAFVKSGLSETAPQPDAFGGFDVSEGFVEVNVPILADMPFAHRLSVDAAYRYADYSTVGGVEAWKVGLLYAPVRDVAFRGTYSEAVRAPNITEAFLPATSGFSSVSDPCDVNNIDNDPNRAANCAADGVPPGFQSNTNVSIDSETSGNINLDPESAETFTAGLIFRPRWVDGLAVTLDYYDIRIDNAIASLSGQTIINECYDGSTLSDQYCSLFTRGGDGNINFVRSTYVNVAALETSGWDMEVSYARYLEDMFPGAAGRLTLSANVNYLEELTTYNFADRPDEPNINKGEIGNPEWSARMRAAWQNGPLTLTWEGRYEGEVSRFERTPEEGVNRAEAIFPNYLGATWYHDLVVNYELPDIGFGTDGVEVYAGVNNLLDQERPYGATPLTTSYELFGRSYFGGLRVRF